MNAIASISEIGIALGVLLAAVAVMLLAGSWLITGRPGQPRIATMQDAFWSLLTGMISITSLYAIAVSGFHTVLLILPVLVFLCCRQLRVKPTPGADSAVAGDMGKVLALTGILTLLSGIAFLMVILHAGPGYSYYGDDQMYYANLSRFLNIFGKEAGTMDFLNPATAPVSPYHYGDIWLIAMFSRITGGTASIALVLCAYPFFMLLASLGILAVLEQTGIFRIRKHFAAGVLSLAVMFAAGYTLLFPYFLFPWDRRNNALYNVPKHIVPSIIYIAMFLAFLRRELRLLVLVCAIGAVFYLSLSITLFLTAGALLLLAFFYRSLIPRKDVYMGGGILMLTGIWLALYYGLAPKGSPAYINDHYGLFHASDLRRGVAGTIFSSILQTTYYLLHLILAIVYLKRRTGAGRPALVRKLAMLLLLPAAVFCAGTIGAVATYNVHMDNWQLFSTLFLPVANCSIMLFYLAVWLDPRAAMPFKVLTALMLTVNVYEALVHNFGFRFKSEHVVSESEYRTVTGFIKEQQPRFGYYQVVIPNAPYTYNSYMQAPCSYLTYFVDPYVCPSVNGIFLPDLPPATPRDIHLRNVFVNNTAIANWYVTNNVPAGTDSTTVTSRYVMENGINYLFYPRATPLPQPLRPLVIDSLFIESQGVTLFHLKTTSGRLAN